MVHTRALLEDRKCNNCSREYVIIGERPSLLILFMGSFVQEPPSFTTRAQDQVVLEGGPPIQLNCVADGEPEPNITWTKVNNGRDGDVLFTGNNFVLPNSRSNAGMYRCNASNGIGNDVNHNATVVVNFASVIVPLVERIIVEKGDDITLFCNASGMPPPSVMWTHVPKGRKQYSQTWLITDIQVSDLGEYRCDANNTYGHATDAVTIELEGALIALIIVAVVVVVFS
ncbi:lachesin-like [Montipora capricornis]|uniref:lachesin-like n=1 Tax=Montipora capricornis TaxID=246305 RepID=UPI0035F16C0D